MSVFFLIGIAINVMVLVAFGAWFVSQWRKTGRSRRNQDSRG